MQNRPPSANPNYAPPPMAGQIQANGPDSQARQAPTPTQPMQKYPQPSMQQSPTSSHPPMLQPPMSQAPMSQPPMSQPPMSQAPMSQAPMTQQPMAQMPPMNTNQMGAPPMPNQQFQPSHAPPGLNQPLQPPFGANNQGFAGQKMPPMPGMPPMPQYPQVFFAFRCLTKASSIQTSFNCKTICFHGFSNRISKCHHNHNQAIHNRIMPNKAICHK